MLPHKWFSARLTQSLNAGEEADVLTRDDLIREARSRSGNLSTFILVYLVIVTCMVSTALLIM